MMTTTKPRKKNDQKQEAILQALDEFNVTLKANSLNAKTAKRAIETKDRQRGDRNALVDSKRKGAQKPTKPADVNPLNAKTAKRAIETEDRLNAKTAKRAIETKDRQRGDRDALVGSKRKGAQKPTKPADVTMEEAEATVEEEVAATQDAAGLDLSDLTYEQVEALKEYGGLTGNMSRKQVDEIISRVSPLTEDGTPFVISTPGPKGRFLNPRRLRVKDIVTGKEILL
jgi:hypothetical protein